MTKGGEKMTFEQGEVEWLIKHLQDMIRLLSEDISISRRYDDLETAKRILTRLKTAKS